MMPVEVIIVTVVTVSSNYHRTLKKIVQSVQDDKLTLISISFLTRLGFTYTRRYYNKAASICAHITKH